MVRYFASGANTSLTSTPSPRREEGVEMGGRGERGERRRKIEEEGGRRGKREEGRRHTHPEFHPVS